MVGKTLGHYEILEPLGAGGMGEVYLGEDIRLGRKVETGPGNPATAVGTSKFKTGRCRGRVEKIGRERA